MVVIGTEQCSHWIGVDIVSDPNVFTVISFEPTIIFVAYYVYSSEHVFMQMGLLLLLHYEI